MNNLSHASSHHPTGSLRIGIAPDSWGVWQPEDTAQPPHDQYIREAAEAGYQWTELGPYGYLGTDPNSISQALARHGLRACAGSVSVSLHEDAGALDRCWPTVQEVARLCRDLDCEHLIVMPKMWRRSPDGHAVGPRSLDTKGWDLLTAAHDELGRRLLDGYGLRQEFHSHVDSMVGSYPELLRFIDGTDPKFTSICLDTGHLGYYLSNGIRLFKDRPGRIGYLHLKQVSRALSVDALKNDLGFATAVARGVMVEPPHGFPDLKELLATAVIHVPGAFAIVEQDMYPVQSPDRPLAVARRTLEYLRTCGTPLSVESWARP